MKPHLLIVEDNKLTSLLLFTVFTSLGFEVKQIENGNDALPYLEANRVDILILDLELPGTTGDVIYSQMKKNPLLAKIPIIPFSAHTDSQKVMTYENGAIWESSKEKWTGPKIVSKLDGAGEKKNITTAIVDEVLKNMKENGIEIPPEMKDYYL